jgi:hypothetical protein
MMTFFLKLLLLYIHSDKYDKEKIDFDSVTSVVDKRTIMFIHRKIHMYLDEKRKVDVHYAIETLLQMLNVIQAMDGSEEFAGMAETLQGNLFYEEDLLKIMGHVIRSCKNEPQSYLELLIETNHVQLKMLERFSKSKRALFVRGKKKVKMADEDDGAIQEAHETKEKYKEKSIRFDQIEAVCFFCDL